PILQGTLSPLALRRRVRDGIRTCRAGPKNDQLALPDPLIGTGWRIVRIPIPRRWGRRIDLRSRFCEHRWILPRAVPFLSMVALPQSWTNVEPCSPAPLLDRGAELHPFSNC